jgi:predicted kinase
MNKKLYIVRGLPGSGKSTFALDLVGSDFLVCEADKYFMVDGEYKFDGSKLKEAHESCRNLVETYMKDSLVNDQFYREIAVSNTFTQAWEMQPYYDLAEKYGYRVYSLIVENRHDGVNQHGVPEEKLVQMKNRFEVQLLPVKEIKLEDVFNDEKKEKLKEFIKEHKDGK